MPDITANTTEWDVNYEWSQAGDEWSSDFGGSASQWYGSLLPRIHQFLPANRVLELAPGFGRWTHFLKSHCRELIGIDLAERCVEQCRRRFAADSHLQFHVNDGYSLQMVEDDSIDFAFSFDSLVHAEADVIESYLRQLATKLRPGGAAFLHHSNIGVYRYYFGVVRRIPIGKDWLHGTGMLQTCGHWRAMSMSARKFRDLARSAGLRCTSQELINWRGKLLIDCISVVKREPVSGDDCRIWKNREFMAHARYLRHMSEHYGSAASPLAQPAASPVLSGRVAE